MEENVKVVFSNGDEIQAVLNGNCFITKSKPEFPKDLTSIRLISDSGTQVIEYGKIVEPYWDGEGYCFGIESVTEAERAAKQVRADVDYLAMELDVEL